MNIEPVSTTPDGKKGRPTPKRKAAEAARIRPLVPKDRKEAKRAARAARNARFDAEQRAMITGEEKYLPARDKGRARRFVRDYVDARHSFSEWILACMMVSLVLLMVTQMFTSCTFRCTPCTGRPPSCTALSLSLPLRPSSCGARSSASSPRHTRARTFPPVPPTTPSPA